MLRLYILLLLLALAACTETSSPRDPPPEVVSLDDGTARRLLWLEQNITELENRIDGWQFVVDDLAGVANDASVRIDELDRWAPTVDAWSQNANTVMLDLGGRMDATEQYNDFLWNHLARTMDVVCFIDSDVGELDFTQVGIKTIITAWEQGDAAQKDILAIAAELQSSLDANAGAHLAYCRTPADVAGHYGYGFNDYW